MSQSTIFQYASARVGPTMTLSSLEQRNLSSEKMLCFSYERFDRAELKKPQPFLLCGDGEKV